MTKREILEINKQRKFSAEYDYYAFAVVRVSPRILKKLGGRNSWVRISSENNHIYRMALGAKSSMGFTQKAMEIDYDSLLELEGGSVPSSDADENHFRLCKYSIRKASFFETLIAHWNHPNTGYRVPMQLSIVGFTLGVIGLVLGILGYA